MVLCQNLGISRKSAWVMVCRLPESQRPLRGVNKIKDLAKMDKTGFGGLKKQTHRHMHDGQDGANKAYRSRHQGRCRRISYKARCRSHFVYLILTSMHVHDRFVPLVWQRPYVW